MDLNQLRPGIRYSLMGAFVVAVCVHDILSWAGMSELYKYTRMGCSGEDIASEIAAGTNMVLSPFSAVEPL